jgi:pimeloyl-ACP methyl ester carboxylesterase
MARSREAVLGGEDGDQLVIELPGGGSLGYAGFGDPDGVPCFAFHGTVSSRLMPGWMFPPDLLTAAGVRMIGVDRPGYGLSRADWAAGFAGWPRAVAALADHLGLGRFAVLAHSLGSAYALACGPALGDRLAVIVIASGMGPLQPGERFRPDNRAEDLYWRLARRQAGWLLNPLCRLSGSMVLRSVRGDPERFAQVMARRLPEADRLTTQRMLTRPGAQPAVIADLRESYRQGTTVMAADLLQYSRPWGFGLEEVTTMVHLWHGEQDPKVPITAARQMAASLPRCQAHFGAGGHLTACDHAAEILTTVTSAFEQDGKER